jgi:hypothetical protein
VIYWLVRPAADCPDVESGASPPGFLSAAERETYTRLTFPKRRREWLLGRWTAKRLLQLSIEAYRAFPLSAITVGNDPDGAPYLSVDGRGRRIARSGLCPRFLYRAGGRPRMAVLSFCARHADHRYMECQRVGAQGSPPGPAGGYPSRRDPSHCQHRGRRGTKNERSET